MFDSKRNDSYCERFILIFHEGTFNVNIRDFYDYLFVYEIYLNFDRFEFRLINFVLFESWSLDPSLFEYRSTDLNLFEKENYKMSKLTRDSKTFLIKEINDLY